MAVDRSAALSVRGRHRPDAACRSVLAGFRHQYRFQALLSRGLIRQEAPIKTGASFLNIKPPLLPEVKLSVLRFACPKIHTSSGDWLGFPGKASV